MKENVAIYLSSALERIKLFHWMTRSYDLHIISGNLYDSLSPEIDAIVEGLMTSKHKLPAVPKNQPKNIVDIVVTLEQFVEQIKERRVQVSVDNVVQIIGKFLYLYEMARTV